MAASDMQRQRWLGAIALEKRVLTYPRLPVMLELTLPIDRACWACRYRYIDGRLPFVPAHSESFQLSWNNSTGPERALVAELLSRGEHVHSQYSLGRHGHRCDILLPYRRRVVEFDGGWSHAKTLWRDRRDVHSIVELGLDIIRFRSPEYHKLGPTGAVDVYPPREYRPDRGESGRMLAAFIDFVLGGRDLPVGWTVVMP